MFLEKLVLHSPKFLLVVKAVNNVIYYTECWFSQKKYLFQNCIELTNQYFHWFCLYLQWMKIGVNVSNFPLSLSAIGFHVGVAGKTLILHPQQLVFCLIYI